MGNLEYLYDELVTLTPLGPEHVAVMTRWVNEQAVVYNLAMLGGKAEDVGPVMDLIIKDMKNSKAVMDLFSNPD